MTPCGHWRVDANRTRLAFYITVTYTCTKWADQGYSQCSQWADQGYSACCDWWPCSWLCDVVVWIAKWVCLASVWVAKWICLFLAWIVNVIWYLIIVLVWEACRPFYPTPPRTSPINHIFVLMLENRAFDHMLGYSRIKGTDAESGLLTQIEGLDNESNEYAGHTFAVSEGADWAMPIDPGHEFPDTLLELCRDLRQNPAPKYPDPTTGGYPRITNGGFAASFASKHDDSKKGDPAQIMRCYSPQQLPVLTTLAQEFAVCDHWFSSLPGPTWPNRFFVHAASSGGLDDSPDPLSSASSALVNGYKFDNGTIYDLLDAGDFEWKIYEGDALPQSFAISGMNLAALEGHFVDYDDFRDQVNDPDYSIAYAFIEPNYGNDILPPQNYKCGNSQHPLDDITRGERLIKDVYETIRNSPHWDDSLLIIIYDEHGGFYDHVHPPAALPPGDSVTDPDNDHHHFKFDQLGVRVPAVIISPRIPRGVIDHRVYDHTSVIRTVEEVFVLDHLTDRDAIARSLTPLLSLSEPRNDTPTSLPNAADSGITECDEPPVERSRSIPAHQRYQPMDASLRGFVHVALLRDLFMSAQWEHPAILDRYATIETKWQAAEYIREVRARYQREVRERFRPLRAGRLPQGAVADQTRRRRRPRRLPKFR